jgi:hypothetical protein
VHDQNTIEDYLHQCGFHFTFMQFDEFLPEFFESLDQEGIRKNFTSALWFFRKTLLFFRACPLLCRANPDYVSSNHVIYLLKSRSVGILENL